MMMRITGVGSYYLAAFVDASGESFDGAKAYKMMLPRNIPAERFWSLTVYDNQTRSMLDTPQRYPRAGSQSYPTPAAEPSADGSTTVYFSPKQPEGVKPGNWIQTMPGKGWFTILRVYSPSNRSSRNSGGRVRSSWSSSFDLPPRVLSPSTSLLRSAAAGPCLAQPFRSEGASS